MIHDVGLLLARIALGASIAAHGAQKAWGAFDGPGPQGAAGFMESLGFRPGGRFATAASSTEIAAGALIVLGAVGPLGPAALLSTMVVAQTTAHAKNGFFAQNGGIELGVMYSTAALALASAGFGRLSLDEVFGWQRLRAPWITAVVVVGGVAVGLAMLAQRGNVQTVPDNLDTASAPDAPTNGALQQDLTEGAAPGSLR